MAAALGSGFPVAYALPGSAILTVGIAAGAGWLFAGSVDAFFYSDGPTQWLQAGVTNQRGVYWEVERDTLIAIPLFIFMGIMLQRSKIAEDLLETMAQLFGPVPGGLGISVVFVGALLAATTGIVGATVVAMGLISLPSMLRNNYSTPLATGTIAASGTLGQIIPPSIVLIILADQLASAADQASSLRKALYKNATGELQMPSPFDVAGTSAGEMFLGAFIPGLVLVGLYMAYILIYAVIRPKNAPAVPYEGKYDMAFLRKVFITLVPPLALIFLVLGSIIAGIATVNQAGAIGAAGAMIMAGYRLPKQGTRGTYAPALLAILALAILGFALSQFNMNIKSMATPADLVFIILLGAAVLTASFRAFGGEELVRNFLVSLPGGFWTQFFMVMLVIFILGFFLDFIEIAVVVVPIVAPILLADPGANVTAVWLGVMIGLNIQTSFLTPPFGFALFYLRGVAPAMVRTLQIYKGVVPFILLQLVALGIVGAYPPLVNYLPTRVNFLSETSPPPRNPKLQICLDDYVGEKLSESSALPDAITAAKMLDLSALPKDLAGAVTDGIASAEDAIAGLAAINEASTAVANAAPDYRPVLAEVRNLQKQMRAAEPEAKDFTTAASRAEDQAEGARLTKLAEASQAEADRLAALIPEDWDSVHSDFAALVSAEDKARNLYRRAADGAYEDPASVLAVLGATGDFAALETGLEALRPIFETGEGDAAVDQIKAFEKLVGDVEGAGDVKSPLSKARRALDKGNRDEALQLYQEALTAYANEAKWRASAEDLVPGLTAYLKFCR
ncbi:MAG: TRAP transporter large permease subunit [Maritimibacter sp.]